MRKVQSPPWRINEPRGRAGLRLRGIEGRADRSRAHLVQGDKAGQLSDPIFILGVPRSFSWLACAMIGQHPQLYALPELQLFSADTVQEWRSRFPSETYPIEHGLLRAVAEICFDGQSSEALQLAKGWVRRRAQSTTGMIVEELAERVHPRRLVEKSPSIVYQREFMERAYRMFPRAGFIHLVRHPIDHGQAVLDAIANLSRFEVLDPSHWLVQLASAEFGATGTSGAAGAPDPQSAWHVLNLNIRSFLEGVPAEQKLLLRGEELLTTPDPSLSRIAAFAGVRTNYAAIERMKGVTA